MSATKYEVASITTTPLTSQVAVVQVSVVVALKVVRRGQKSYVLQGKVVPVVPGARVRVQRQTPRGRWATIDRVHTRSGANNTSKFTATLPRISRDSRYRFLVSPHDQGAHVTTTSATVAVAKKKKS